MHNRPDNSFSARIRARNQSRKSSRDCAERFLEINVSSKHARRVFRQRLFGHFLSADSTPARGETRQGRDFDFSFPLYIRATRRYSREDNEPIARPRRIAISSLSLSLPRRAYSVRIVRRVFFSPAGVVKFKREKWNSATEVDRRVL